MKRLIHYVFLRRTGSTEAWGSEEQILSILEHIDYSVYKITVVATQDAFSQRIAERELPVNVMTFPFKFPVGFFERFFIMKQFLKSLHPDSIVYVPGAFFEFALSDYLAGFLVTKGKIFSLEVSSAPRPPQKLSRKHWGVIPGIGLWWYGHMFMSAVRGFLLKRVIAVGKEVARRLTQWYHYPSWKIVTIYHGIDLTKFRPDETVRNSLRKQYGIMPHETILISTARLSQEKCIDRLINAFDTIASEFHNCRLILIGNGHLEKELIAQAQKKSAKNRIMFLGFKENVADYLKMSDVFVLTSDTEGLSNAMIEAMATGLVCVVTDVPGSSEAIQNSVTGFVVERSEQGIYEGLRMALSMSKEEYKRMSEAAATFIHNNFDVKNGIQNELETFELI